MTIPPKPFKDLSDAEKGALLLAHHEGKRIEFCWPDDPVWRGLPNPAWAYGVIYRIAPEPKTPDTINWDHVAREYNFMARDAGGEAYVYAGRPSILEKVWDGCSDQRNTRAFASYRRGTVDWKDSLVIRPSYGAAQ